MAAMAPTFLSGQRNTGSDCLQRELVAQQRSRVAAISAAEMRAPPQFANFRWDRWNRGKASPASKRHDSRYPIAICTGSRISMSPWRLTGVVDVVFAQAG